MILDTYKRILAFIPGLQEHVDWTRINDPKAINTLGKYVSAQFLLLYFLTDPPVSWKEQRSEVIPMTVQHFARMLSVTYALLKASPSWIAKIKSPTVASITTRALACSALDTCETNLTTTGKHSAATWPTEIAALCTTTGHHFYIQRLSITRMHSMRTFCAVPFYFQ